jgi:hypothetical protein
LFGKHFASMYSGSMFGKPALVFAVWGYAISNMRPSRRDGESYVELNPTLLASTFATTTDAVIEAIGVLESPDPASRTKRDDGRRLVLISGERSVGPMQYLVVNGSKYRALRDEEERRVYLRERKRESRQRSTKSETVNRRQPPYSQVEEETVEGDVDPLTDSSGRPDVSPRSKEIAAVFERWRSAMNKPEAKLTPKRRRLIEARLKDSTLDEILAAVAGCAASAWHMGANQSGTRYDDLTLICRDREHIERFMAPQGRPGAVVEDDVLAQNKRVYERMKARRDARGEH